jgi:hypothetical protein
VRPGALAFGDLAPGQVAHQSVEIANVGRTPASLSMTLSGATSHAFAADRETTLVLAGTSATVRVGFEPPAAEDYEGDLVVSDGEAVVARVALRGRAVIPPVEKAPPVACADGDRDGFGEGCVKGPDCDDANPLAHMGTPGRSEDCGNLADDNCNGEIDEQCCAEGAVLSCPIPPGVGACGLGKRVCRSGVFGVCEGPGRPSVELCNRVDDDCDGIVDNGRACAPPSLYALDGIDGTWNISADGGSLWEGPRAITPGGPWHIGATHSSLGLFTLLHDGQLFVSLDRGGSNRKVATTGLPSPAGLTTFALASDGREVLAAYCRRGELYASADGVSWTLRGRWSGAGVHCSLAMDSARRVYVLEAAYSGAAVYRSEDGGASFLRAGAYSPLRLGGGASLVVDDRDRLYALVDAGGFKVYQSVDRGETFALRGGGPTQGAMTMAFDVHRRELLIGGSNGDVLASTDEAATFVPRGKWGGRPDQKGWLLLVTDPASVRGPGGAP